MPLRSSPSLPLISLSELGTWRGCLADLLLRLHHLESSAYCCYGAASCRTPVSQKQLERLFECCPRGLTFLAAACILWVRRSRLMRRSVVAQCCALVTSCGCTPELAWGSLHISSSGSSSCRVSSSSSPVVLSVVLYCVAAPCIILNSD